MSFLSWASANQELTIVGMVATSIVGVMIVSIISSSIRRIWLGQQKLALKQSMVDVGMSVEEISEVMKT